MSLRNVVRVPLLVSKVAFVRNFACSQQLNLSTSQQLNLSSSQQLNLACSPSLYVTSSQQLNKLITISGDEEFLTKVMHTDRPVIINFHAEWCEPCHILTPKLKELLEAKENIDLAIVDVESHAELVHTFEVKAVPAVIALKNGIVIDKFIGLVDATMIDKLIQKLDDIK